jgi:hypothetical protein
MLFTKFEIAGYEIKAFNRREIKMKLKAKHKAKH